MHRAEHSYRLSGTAAVRHQVATHWVSPLFTAASRLGIERQRLLSAAGLPLTIGVGRGFDRHLSLDQYLRLWEVALAETGRSDLPLICASTLNLGTFNVIGFACMTSRNLGEGFHRLARYYHILCSAARWSLGETPDRLTLLFELAGSGGPGIRAATEFAVAEVVHFARLITANPIPIAGITFRHARAAPESVYRDFFRVPVRWNAIDTSIVLDRAAFEIPFPKWDPYLLAFFERHAEALAQTQLRQVSSRVRCYLMNSLAQGEASLEAAAKQMAMSPRSLRRHLQTEGTSFQALLADTRTTLARRYLRDPRLTIGEVAFLVGFSELSPFQRFFRRVVGLSPGAFREQAAVTETALGGTA
jgi:AraC-like DNA-binding protein